MAGNNAASPPFATPDGKPKTPSGNTATGGHNFLTDPNSSSGAGGGRDFTKESRPQPSFKAQPGLPNSESIPAGGKVLLADPKGVDKTAGGNANPIKPASGPFKGLK